MKYIFILAFVAILGSLAAALVFMMKGEGVDEASRTKRMARSLALRVGFSVLLFLGILLAWSLGYIQPTGHP
jgi:hypothetical protein